MVKHGFFTTAKPRIFPSFSPPAVHPRRRGPSPAAHPPAPVVDRWDLFVFFRQGADQQDAVMLLSLNTG